MPDFSRTGWIGTKRAFALIIITSFLLFSLSGIAAATTPKIQKAQDQAEALRALIEQLDEELSAAAEEYNYATQELSDTQAAVKKTKKQLATAEADLGTVQERLNRRVVDIYKSGDLSMLSVLLGANSFSDLIGRYERLQRLGAQDAELMAQVSEYKVEAGERKAQLDSQLIEEKTAVEAADAAKEKVETQLAKQKTALKGKEAQITQLKKEEAARQAALAAAAKKAAEEAKRRAEAARAAAAAAAAAARRNNNTTTTQGSGGGGGGSIGYDEERSQRVVDIAMQYLGVPYVWGGESPRGFDCSGLVKYSYAKLGIYLPHSSRMQYNYGTYVPKSSLKPGDLVFFYNPIHHVGIYIGNGKIVHASGNQVQMGTVNRSSYTGARRILD